MTPGNKLVFKKIQSLIEDNPLEFGEEELESDR